MDSKTLSDFPVFIEESESQLDRVEAKLDAIIMHMNISVPDNSRDAQLARLEFDDINRADVFRLDLRQKVLNYFKELNSKNELVTLLVRRPFTFTTDSGKEQLYADENSNAWEVRIGFMPDSSIPDAIWARKTPFCSTDRSIAASTRSGVIVEEIFDGFLDRKLDVLGTPFGDVDLAKCVPMRRDFEMYWDCIPVQKDSNGNTYSIDGAIKVLKHIPICNAGEKGPNIILNPCEAPRPFSIERLDDDFTNCNIDGLELKHVKHKDLGTFLYQCMLMGEIEIPNYTKARSERYSGWQCKEGCNG